MAFNQISNQNQAITSPPLHLITDPQMMNSHVNNQQLNHGYPLPDPINQPPTLANEFSQLSFDINNQREKIEDYLHLQYLQRVDAIMTGSTNQGMLVQNYVSKLLALIHEKEQELVAANQTNNELNNCITDVGSKLQALQQIAWEKEGTVANLNQQLEMLQENQQMMATNEPDAGSACVDLLKDIIDSNCQMCSREHSSVIIFPCKHLCCCKQCEAYVYSCPVCEKVKESSTEVSWPVMKNVEETKRR